MTQGEGDDVIILSFMSLDIGDVEGPKNWIPFLVLVLFQQTLIKIKSLIDLQTSLVLHLMSLTLT